MTQNIKGVGREASGKASLASVGAMLEEVFSFSLGRGCGILLTTTVHPGDEDPVGNVRNIDSEDAK